MLHGDGWRGAAWLLVAEMRRLPLSVAFIQTLLQWARPRLLFWLHQLKLGFAGRTGPPQTRCSLLHLKRE